jgi:HlyD family secretion protein
MRSARRAVIAGVMLLGVVGAVSWVAVNGGAADGGAVAPAVATGTALVVRTDIAQRQPVNGLLGHTGTLDVVSAGQGTLTGLPAVGAVVRRGEPAYEVDGKNVPLLYGNRPAWRGLQLGMSDGADVLQLETNLKALGYGHGLTVDRHFSDATYWAVRHWQEDLKVPETGGLALGQVVFVPGEVRVSGQDVKIGQRLGPGQVVVHGTSDERAVMLQLSPANIPQVRVDDQAVVTLPDGTTRQGTIREVGAVAAQQAAGSSAPAQSVAPVTITVQGAIREFLDQAEVQVLITSAERKNVLAVPTVALFALPGGTYEVIVVAGAERRHVAVETGLFDETTGLVEVSGTGLSEGQRVEVPNGSS